MRDGPLNVQRSDSLLFVSLSSQMQANGAALAGKYEFDIKFDQRELVFTFYPDALLAPGDVVTIKLHKEAVRLGEEYHDANIGAFNPAVLTTFNIPDSNPVTLKVKFTGVAKPDAQVAFARHTADLLLELREALSVASGLDVAKIGAIKCGPVAVDSALDVHQLKNDNTITVNLLA